MSKTFDGRIHSFNFSSKRNLKKVENDQIQGVWKNPYHNSFFEKNNEIISASFPSAGSLLKTCGKFSPKT